MFDLLPPLCVLITVTASFQYFCGTSVFKNLRGLSLPAISWYLEQFCVHCIYFYFSTYTVSYVLPKQRNAIQNVCIDLNILIQ